MCEQRLVESCVCCCSYCGKEYVIDTEIGQPVERTPAGNVLKGMLVFDEQGMETRIFLCTCQSNLAIAVSIDYAGVVSMFPNIRLLVQ